MGERCGCSFSTLPGKQLRCIEATRHQGPHHADGVTWPQLFPKRSEEVPDGRRLGLEGRAPATTAASTPDPDWDDNAPERPLAERVPWRIGVLDKDRLNDPDTIRDEAIRIAGWYVTDCAEALEQLQATRAPLAELAVLRHSNNQMRDLTREQDQAIQALRDKVADLEVYAAGLHDLLSELHERGPTRTLHAKITDALAVQPPQHRRQLQDKVERIADERDHFQAGMHRMREALTGLRQGRLTGEQANDEFFDGYQQTKQAFAAALLVRDIKAAARDQGEAQTRQLLGYQTSDGRLYRPEDITLVYDLDQGEAQGGEP